MAEKTTGNGPDPLIDLRNVDRVCKTSTGDLLALADIRLQACSGKIVFRGISVHILREGQLARFCGKNLGVVFQLLSSLNLIENITRRAVGASVGLPHFSISMSAAP